MTTAKEEREKVVEFLLDESEDGDDLEDEEPDELESRIAKLEEWRSVIESMVKGTSDSLRFLIGRFDSVERDASAHWRRDGALVSFLEAEGARLLPDDATDMQRARKHAAQSFALSILRREYEE